MRHILIILSILLLLLASCTTKEQKSYSNGPDLVEAVKSDIKYISVTDFKTVMESGDPYYLIDCRESEEFDISCIQGALSVPRGVLENEIGNLAPSKRVPLFVYCTNGQRSVLAASVLPRLKYSCVRVIEGGFEAWQETLPELVEVSPVRGSVKKTVAAPSGGCGG